MLVKSKGKYIKLLCIIFIVSIMSLHALDNYIVYAETTTQIVGVNWYGSENSLVNSGEKAFSVYFGETGTDVENTYSLEWMNESLCRGILVNGINIWEYGGKVDERPVRFHFIGGHYIFIVPESIWVKGLTITFKANTILQSGNYSIGKTEKCMLDSIEKNGTWISGIFDVIATNVNGSNWLGGESDYANAGEKAFSLYLGEASTNSATSLNLQTTNQLLSQGIFINDVSIWDYPSKAVRYHYIGGHYVFIVPESIWNVGLRVAFVKDTILVSKQFKIGYTENCELTAVDGCGIWAINNGFYVKNSTTNAFMGYSWNGKFTLPNKTPEGNVICYLFNDKYYAVGEEISVDTVSVSIKPFVLDFKIQSGASIRTGICNGIRFSCSVNISNFENLKSIFGADNVKLYSELTKTNNNKIICEISELKQIKNGTGFYMSLYNISENNYNTEIHANSYITIKVNGETYKTYASIENEDNNSNTRSLAQVYYLAYNERSASQNETYLYLTEDGDYSKLTNAELIFIKPISDLYRFS